MLRDINQESLTFYMYRCARKKNKIDVKGRQSGAPCIGSQTMRAIKSEPLASFKNTYY
jgi:hypothetical protein